MSCGAAASKISSSVAPSLSLGDGGHHLGDMTATHWITRMTSAEPIGVHDQLRGVPAQAGVGRVGRQGLDVWPLSGPSRTEIQCLGVIGPPVPAGAWRVSAGTALRSRCFGG
jgi:hypothetical protein